MGMVVVWVDPWRGGVLIRSSMLHMWLLPYSPWLGQHTTLWFHSVYSLGDT